MDVRLHGLARCVAGRRCSTRNFASGKTCFLKCSLKVIPHGVVPPHTSICETRAFVSFSDNQGHGCVWLSTSETDPCAGWTDPGPRVGKRVRLQAAECEGPQETHHGKATSFHLPSNRPLRASLRVYPVLIRKFEKSRKCHCFIMPHTTLVWSDSDTRDSYVPYIVAISLGYGGISRARPEFSNLIVAQKQKVRNRFSKGRSLLLVQNCRTNILCAGKDERVCQCSGRLCNLFG